MAKDKDRFTVSIICRLVVTLALLILIFLSIDTSQLKTLFKRMNLLWIAAACPLIILLRCLSTFRWAPILKSQGLDISLGDLFRVIILSEIVGRVLPGSGGTDLTRGYQIVRQHGRVISVAGTLVIDRIIGLYSLTALALVGALVLWFSGSSPDLAIWLSLLNVVLILGALLISHAGSRLVTIKIFSNSRFEQGWSKMAQALHALTNTQTLRQVFPRVFSICLVVQLARSVMFYCLYRSLGETVSFTYFVIFIPLIFVALAAPISLGGLGVREVSLAYLFGTVGIAAEVSVSAGILNHFLQIIISLALLVPVLLREKLGSHLE